MPLSIDKDNFLIKTRRGDSLTIIFKFNMPVDDFFVDFCVVKELNNLDTMPVIQKCYRNITGNVLEVKLSSEDTEKLRCEGTFAGRYFWGLRIHNDDGFASTLIPNRFNHRPEFIVYPKIGECLND